MRRTPYLPLITLIVAWLATYLPLTWWKGGAAFSANVHDLAEWISLIPSVRYGASSLLIPGLLRVIPGLLAIALAVEASRLPDKNTRLRWLVRSVAILVCVGLMPPFEFFRGNLGDVNYRQQALIAVLTGLAVLVMIIRPIRLVGVVALLLTAICSVVGVLGSQRELSSLRTEVLIGPGLVLLIAASGMYGVLSIRNHVSDSPSLAGGEGVRG